MTEHYYFAGTCKWAQVYKVDEKYRNWKIDLYLDEDSQALFTESGMTSKLKSDDDGLFITLRRRDQQLMGKELKDFDPPTVVDNDGTPMTDLIGNGSSVVAKVAVFDTRNGVGHRLEGIMVQELVPYEGETESQIEVHKPSGMADIPTF